MNALKWKTYDGRQLTAKEMSDDHLTNVIYHIVKLNLSQQMLRECLEEFIKRNLNIQKFEQCPIPFINKNGKKMQWNYQKMNIEESV